MIHWEDISAVVSGASHWFNRVMHEGVWLDVDVTGDQFGRPVIQTAEPGMLYDGTRLRHGHELNAEAIERGRMLIERSKLIM